jgi:outer membrane protein TolC
VEKQKFDLINELGIATLKFQIGMPQETNLSLSGSINDVKADTFNVKAVDNDFNYNKRIEYRLLETQKKLQEYDVKNIGFGYAPRLSAFGNLGGNAATTEIASWHTSANFFNFGLTLNVPVFDGLNKAYRIQQSKINLVKADNNIKNIKNTIDFQLIQSENTLRNSIKSLSIQKNNLDLSNEVAQVTRRKYEKGVGSNLELITAESALKEALINYYSALYDVIVSKVDFDKATGNLK